MRPVHQREPLLRPELDRRDFLKITGLSAGAAATVACKEPVEKVIPSTAYGIGTQKW